MRFLHTADWHLGKKLNGYDLLEEQQAAFEELLKIAQEEQVEAIVIAGDIFDRALPAAETVDLYNQMLIRLNLEAQFPVLAIAGNHDSSSRLATGTPWFAQQAFHLHTRLEEAFQPIEIAGVQFFLLPYFEPFEARTYFADETITSVSEAMALVIEKMQKSFKADCQQVLVTHFFVAGSLKSESETKVMVGGLDAIPADLLTVFDYVALGHLHSKDALKTETIKYSGALLKYALSETSQAKGVYIVDVLTSGVKTKFRTIQPLRDVECLEGYFSELTAPEFYEQKQREHYFGIRLKDLEVIPQVMQQLRLIYPRIIQLERVHPLYLGETPAVTMKNIPEANPQAFFSQYYAEVVGEELSPQQVKWLQDAIQDAEKEE